MARGIPGVTDSILAELDRLEGMFADEEERKAAIMNRAIYARNAIDALISLLSGDSSAHASEDAQGTESVAEGSTEPHSGIADNREETKQAPTHKVCAECGEDKPLDEYQADNRTADGYRKKCRACCRKKSEFTIKPGKQQRRRCKVCGRILDISNFTPRSNGNHAYTCHECTKKKRAENEKLNAEGLKKMDEPSEEPYYASQRRITAEVDARNTMEAF